MYTKNTFTYYLDKRIFSVFILGMASGLPWVMIGSALTLWLKESGVSRTNIGYSGMIFAVFAINFLWSPIVDRVQLTGSIFKLNRRQSWIIPCQLMIASLCFGLYFLSPDTQAKAVVFLALLIALCAATQDIAIDAYRIDSFDQNEKQALSAAAGAATAGWWTGYAAIGFVPLYLSDNGWSWQSLYVLLGCLPLATTLAVLLLPKPKYSHTNHQEDNLAQYQALTHSLPFSQKFLLCSLVFSPILLALWAFFGSTGMPESIANHASYVPILIITGLGLAVLAGLKLGHLLSQTSHATLSTATGFDRVLARMLLSVCEPVQDFFKRNGTKLALQILFFIFLFKIGEAFLGKMSIVFYKEIGFSNTDIATYSKMLTWWVTIIAAVFAGALTARFGLIRGLFISGIAMAGSNLMFALIALSGPSIWLYQITIVIDGIASAWSTVAFVAFISALCNHAFSASQYALLASLGALGRTTLSSLSGQFVDFLNGNWALFFVITTLMVIPSLMMLRVLARSNALSFANKDSS